MALVKAGYWSPTYWLDSYWANYWPGYAEPPVGGPGHPREREKPPIPPWFSRRRAKAEDIIGTQVAKAMSRIDTRQAAVEHQDEMYKLDLQLQAAAKEIDNRIALEKVQDQGKYIRRKQNLLNLERAKFAKEKKKKRVDEIAQARLENLKKARAAKKRKRKKKKK